MIQCIIMKTKIFFIIASVVLLGFCKPSGSGSKELGGGMGSLKDESSQKNIVQIASESPEHKTLVTAVKAANLVDALANPGPFTVFAPNDSAFSQISKNELEALLKPENKGKLTDILYHHVFVGVLSKDTLKERYSSSQLIMFDGKPAKIELKGNDIFINDARIIASVNASNGIIHVIDKVLVQ